MVWQGDEWCGRQKRRRHTAYEARRREENAGAERRREERKYMLGRTNWTGCGF